MFDWFASKLAPLFRKREIPTRSADSEILALKLRRSFIQGEIEKAIRAKKARKGLYAQLDKLTARQLELEAGRGANA